MIKTLRNIILMFSHFIILNILFCRVNINLLFDELNQKIVSYLLLSENRQNNFFLTKSVLLMRNIHPAV